MSSCTLSIKIINAPATNSDTGFVLRSWTDLATFRSLALDPKQHLAADCCKSCNHTKFQSFRVPWPCSLEGQAGLSHKLQHDRKPLASPTSVWRWYFIKTWSTYKHFHWQQCHHKTKSHRGLPMAWQSNNAGHCIYPVPKQCDQTIIIVSTGVIIIITNCLPLHGAKRIC